MINIKKTERGWGGHFCSAHRCLFRRNTLIEYGDNKIVVSTVGNMIDLFDGSNEITPVGADCYYETMAFWSNMNDTRYYDADFSMGIDFDSDSCIEYIDADDKANEMHDNVVNELCEKLVQGLQPPHIKEIDNV